VTDTRTPVAAGETEAGGDPAAPSRYGWAIVASLAVTQTVGYGVLYYAYAVFLTPMATALHASTTVVAGALTCSVLASAAAAVPVGRWLDRHGGRALMVAGSITATLLLVGWSQIHSVPALYLVWIGIGLASACVLYEAAFAVVVTWFRDRRATALLALTLVAGFASSIFLPLTGQLVDRYGWRTAIITLAAIHAATTIPGHLLVRRPSHLAARQADPGATDVARRRIVSTALHDPAYWCLAVAFVASAAAIATIAIHLVAYLTQLGHRPGFAATVAGLLGILSVTGRLATTAATTWRLSPTTVTAIVFLIQATAAACLPLVGHSDLGAVVCVLGFGIGFGVATIARPAILADRYGTTAYATIASLLAVPLTIAKALAPLAAAALHDGTGNYTGVAAGTAGLCLIAAAALLRVRHRNNNTSPVTAKEGPSDARRQ
jgi:predicted MFS family arabinose efflux permease